MKCKHCLEEIPDRAKRCSKCHSDLKSIPASWLKTALLAGAGVFATAVITGSIVPGVSAELDHDRSVRDERMRIAHGITEQGTNVEIDINNLTTMFGVFVKDARTMSPGELRAAQERARVTVADRYLAFERTAWWWYGNAQRDARFPEPLEGWRAKQLDDLCKDYAETLGATTKALNETWTKLLREPADKGWIARQEALLKAQQTVLKPLGEKRRDLYAKMASIFEQPEPRRWFEFWRREFWR